MDVYKDHVGGVMLNLAEHEITDLALQLVVEEDMDMAEAARHALCALPHPDPLFVRWLTQGSVLPGPH
jgi:hypothetical protein